MPDEETMEHAQEDLREGKSPSTAAGEFVHEEMDHIREGKHGARSTKQAIAIGLSKARRAGIPLKPPAAGKASAKTRKSAASAYRKGQAKKKRRPSAKRSRAATQALKREGHSAASRKSLSRQAKSVARKRGSASRKQSALKAARTRAAGRKGVVGKTGRSRRRAA